MAVRDTRTEPGKVVIPTERLVVFYLLNETRYPVISARFKAATALDTAHGAGLMVTLPSHASVEQPCCLLTLGADPQQCDVVLSAEGIKPVHCKVWIQLNSGTHVLLVNDRSATGTQYCVAEGGNRVSTKTVVSQIRAVKGLQALKVGPYYFTISYPKQDQESPGLERWTLNHEPIPVTKAMLDHQCKGLRRHFYTLDRIGRGGNGTVGKCIEKHCGLMVAVKQVSFLSAEHQYAVLEEVRFMRTLKHVSRPSTCNLSNLTTAASSCRYPLS